MLEARVKPDYSWTVVRACAGTEFVKTEWRRVPAAHEDDARTNPLLEWRERDGEPDEPEPAPVTSGPVLLEDVIEGTVAELRDFVAGLADRDELEKLYELEEFGKARAGALEAIGRRLAELNATYVGG